MSWTQTSRRVEAGHEPVDVAGLTEHANPTVARGDPCPVKAGLVACREAEPGLTQEQGSAAVLGEA